MSSKVKALAQMLQLPKDVAMEGIMMIYKLEWEIMLNLNLIGKRLK
jgi:hypothetical protein